MPIAPTRLGRTDVLAGVGFIVFFVAGVISSSPPSDNASDATWIASYTSTGHDWSHVASGVFLILAGLSLMGFLVGMWRYLNGAHQAGLSAASPLPLVAAGVAATCMATGGILMGYVPGSELLGSYPLPSVDLLRMSNDLGFVLTGVPGMIATALCLAVLAAQGRAAGVFGAKMAAFTRIVAVVLLLGFLFLPIVALLVWVVVCLVGARRATRDVLTSAGEAPARAPGGAGGRSGSAARPVPR